MIRPMVSPRAYLDYQATTPLEPLVRDTMLPYLEDHFGNPHSVDHSKRQFRMPHKHIKAATFR